MGHNWKFIIDTGTQKDIVTIVDTALSNVKLNPVDYIIQHKSAWVYILEKNF